MAFRDVIYDPGFAPLNPLIVGIEEEFEYTGFLIQYNEKAYFAVPVVPNNGRIELCTQIPKNPNFIYDPSIETTLTLENETITIQQDGIDYPVKVVNPCQVREILNDLPDRAAFISYYVDNIPTAGEPTLLDGMDMRTSTVFTSRATIEAYRIIDEVYNFGLTCEVDKSPSGNFFTIDWLTITYDQFFNTDTLQYVYYVF